MIINPESMSNPYIMYPPISKRSYQEAIYRKCLDPNMSDMERFRAERDFFYRKDVDVINALTDRPDATQRGRAFLMSLYNAIETDDESFDKTAVAVLNALCSNNAQELLVALCGWNAGSIAKRARIIPDDAYDFYDEDPDATILVHWSNGETSTAKCKVDAKTNKLYGYRRKVFAAHQKNATITGVEVEVKPCFGKERYTYDCITKEQRIEKKDYVSYWYSTDPNEDRETEPSIMIDNPYKRDF